MKLATPLLVAAAMAATAVVATATQTTRPATIAFVNGDRVLEGSAVGRAARKKLEAAAAQWQDRISKEQAELDRLTKNRRDQSLTLNESALARLNQDIEERDVAIQRMNDDARRELQRLEQEITLDVNSQLGPLVDRFAAQTGYDMIFDSARMQGVLYVADGHDVTDDFLAMVNASLPADQNP